MKLPLWHGQNILYSCAWFCQQIKRPTGRLCLAYNRKANNMNGAVPPKNNKLRAEGVESNTAIILDQTNAEHSAAAHLVRDILGVRLALRCSAGQGARSDVA